MLVVGRSVRKVLGACFALAAIARLDGGMWWVMKVDEVDDCLGEGSGSV
jgi:hypothetical protein